jgi:DNA invertase Pin-like site-specific DNA recombinase
MAGLAAARSRGRVGGRPPVMTPEKIKVARDLYQARDLTVEEIAKTIGVSRKTVYRHLIDSPTEASAQIA